MVALYRLSAKMGKRSAGHNAVAAAAYRSGEKLEEQEQGKTFDYSRRQRIEHTEIMTPNGAPEWMKDRAKLWNEIERVESHKNAQVYREVLLSLPRELDEKQRRELVRGFVQENFVEAGMVADVALHQTQNDNPHAHVMLTTRKIEGDGFTKTKTSGREWNSKAALQGWRESWETHVNEALESAGSAARVDHRSKQAQGLDREPLHSVSMSEYQLQQKGETTRHSSVNRSLAALNKMRDSYDSMKDKGLDKIGAAFKQQHDDDDARRLADAARKSQPAPHHKPVANKAPSAYRDDWRERVSHERNQRETESTGTPAQKRR